MKIWTDRTASSPVPLRVLQQWALGVKAWRSFLRVAIVVTAFIAITGAMGSCKHTSSVSTGKSEATEGGYRGPNMSLCGGDPASCRCELNNEFDTADRRAPPPGTDPEKVKQWFSQCIGQETWYKATAGSGRFHAYFQSQKLGAYPDWGLIFHAEARPTRFKHWGVVNDPSCCTPGKNCQGKFIRYQDGTSKEVKSLDDTFGWEFCPGDETLLGYVGSRKDYTAADAACGYDQLVKGVKTAYGVELGLSSKSCHLAFGTSAGAVGFRKFPNPRFNPADWTKLNGNPASWQNYSRRQLGGGDFDMSAFDAASARGKASRVEDGSVEPPFLIGESCGTCHVGFNPTRPPTDPVEPAWDNILFAIGNIYLRPTDMLAAGTTPGTYQNEVFLHARPGTVDTSAITNDYNNNPGTFNAMINTDQRPGIVASAGTGADFDESGPNAPAERFCESVSTFPKLGFEKECGGGNGKKRVPHILKGGDDSVGPAAAVQRVYFNIFSCSETCLGNHLDDPRALSGKGSRQTPFDIAQCTRDCPSVGAVFDRIGDIYSFLLKVRPNDLRDNPSGKAETDAIQAMKDNAGKSIVERGAKIYAQNCARCHSSFPGQSNEQVGLFANGVLVEPDQDTVVKVLLEDLARPQYDTRRDWLGSDVRIPVRLKDLNTNYCRALHTNHMDGHLWHTYGSDTSRSVEKYAPYAAQDFEFPLEGLSTQKLGGSEGLFRTLGGRGFYRAISLLNVWAHAPFMHNNAVGADYEVGFPFTKLTSEVDGFTLPADPSIKGRLAMFEKSMDALLTAPEQRNGATRKVEVSRNPIQINLAPALPDSIKSLPGLAEFLKSSDGTPLTLTLPKGLPISILGGIREKKLINDFIHAGSSGATFSDRMKNARAFLAKFSLADPNAVVQALIAGEYVNCTDTIEDAGHSFGTTLSAPDKKALIEFMKLL